VCLRGPEDQGYPLGDCAVYDYFSHLHNDNDLSISAHAAIARFLGAAHKTMLKWLKEAQTTHLAEELPNYWHDLMEGPERTERERFFGEVVKVAREFVCFWHSQFTLKLKLKGTPPRDATEPSQESKSSTRQTWL
jgi:hypothetical protein